MSPALLPQNSCILSPYSFQDTIALIGRYLYPDYRVSSNQPGHWTRKSSSIGATSCSILFLGDLMVGSASTVGPRLRTLISNVDYVVINMEAPVVPNQAMPSYWQRLRHGTSQALLSFSANPDYLHQILGPLDKDKVIFNISNNHANDGDVALTVRTLHEAGYNLVGDNTNPYIITTMTGARIGLLGCSTLMNWGRYDSVCLANDILALANTQGGDLSSFKERLNLQSFALTIHWDHEYSAIPSKTTEAAAQRFADIGFDVIVGHGPHVVQRMDILMRGVEEIPVAYSVGNLASRRLNSQNARGYAHVVRYDSNGAVIRADQWAFHNDGTLIELHDDPDDDTSTAL
jgi:hypothetical protein